jgi:hypothetical protein
VVGLAGMVFPGGNLAFSIIGMGLIIAGAIVINVFSKTVGH